MGNTSQSVSASKRRIFNRGLGINFLALMPLVSLSNVREVALISGLSIRSIDLLFCFAWIVWGYRSFLCGKIRKDGLTFIGLVFLLFIISFLGVGLLPDYRVDWAGLFRFTQTLLWGALALFYVNSRKDIDSVVGSVVLAGAVLATWSVYLYLTVPGLHRIAGFFSAAGGEGLGRQASFNEIGALYALAALLSAVYLFWSDYRSRSWSLVISVGMILNVVGMLLVQSRSAFLALFVGGATLIVPQLLIQMYKYGRFRLSVRTIVRSSTGIVACIGIFLASEHFVPINRIFLTWSIGSSEHVSMTTRFSLWSLAISGWLNDWQSFLLGHGFGTMDRFIEMASAHNFFLNAVLWFGFTGMVVVMRIFMWPIMRSSGSSNSLLSKVVIATFSVAVVVSMTGNVLVDPFYGGATFLLLYGAVAARHSFTE